MKVLILSRDRKGREGVGVEEEPRISEETKRRAAKNEAQLYRPIVGAPGRPAAVVGYQQAAVETLADGSYAITWKSLP